jgi:hypothetical protein
MSSANTFTSLLPALKESYPKKTEKRSENKFKKLKDKLKKYNK